MTEPAVALTDYALAVETAAFAALLGRGPRSRLQGWLVVYFASLCGASLCGGTVHGFFLDHSQPGWAILWTATLLCIGVTALATWNIAAELLDARTFARVMHAVAAMQFGVYSLLVLLVTKGFWAAIAVNLPAVLFLLATLFVKYTRRRQRALLVVGSGLLLSLAAAGLQQAQIGFHPVHFNHNAVYHLIQAVALYLFYRGGRLLAEGTAVAA